MTVLTLPPLDSDCRYCTGPAGAKMRAENSKEWRKWSTDEQKAWTAFCEEYEKTRSFGTFEAWTKTEQYRELERRKPEELPDVGCVECEWTGKEITEAGRQVLAFLQRHTKLTMR